MASRLALVVLSSGLVAASAAAAPAARPADQLKQAVDAYDSYEYPTAIAKLQALLATNPADAKLRQRARLMLAFSRYWQHDEDGARNDLKALFRENADYALDREMHTPELVKFFDQEHVRFVTPVVVPVVTPAVTPTVTPPPSTAPTSAPAIVARPASTPVVTPRRSDVQAPPRVTLGDRQPWLRIFPIGIGQFANGDHAGGGAFLAVELALVGANVGGAIWRYSLQVPGGFHQGAQQAQILQDAAGLAAIVVAVIGIVDAFVWSPARGRAKSARTAELDLGPFGAYALSAYVP